MLNLLFVFCQINISATLSSNQQLNHGVEPFYFTPSTTTLQPPNLLLCTFQVELSELASEMDSSQPLLGLRNELLQRIPSSNKWSAVYLTAVKSCCVGQVPRVRACVEVPNTHPETVQTAPLLQAVASMCDRDWQHLLQSTNRLFPSPLTEEPLLSALPVVQLDKRLSCSLEGRMALESLYRQLSKDSVMQWVGRLLSCFEDSCLVAGSCRRL